jgi:hypothetical protein
MVVLAGGVVKRSDLVDVMDDMVLLFLLLRQGYDTKMTWVSHPT